MKQVENVVNNKKITVIVRDGAVYQRKDPQTKSLCINKQGNFIQVGMCQNQFIAEETFYTVFGRKAEKNYVTIPGLGDEWFNQVPAYCYLDMKGQKQAEFEGSPKIVTIEKGTLCWIDKNGCIHKAEQVGWNIIVTVDGVIAKQYAEPKTDREGKPTPFTEDSLLTHFLTRAVRELLQKQ